MNDHQFHELRAALQRACDGDEVNVAAVERVKATTQQHLAQRDAVHDAIAGKLYTRKPDGLNDRFAEDEGERAAADLKTLDAGNWRDGFWDARLRPFVGGPSRAALRHLVAACDKVLAQHRSRQAAAWPAAYRFTGSRGTHVVDGVVMKPGDVVTLTEAQAEAWADRFERLEEPVTS
jgi:hypothetical protein